MLDETHGHDLRHRLFLGQPLLHEQLQLHACLKGRDGRLQVFRQQSVDGDVRAAHRTFDMGLAVAEDVLLEKRRNVDDGRDTSFAHEPLGLLHALHLVGDHRRRRVVDHLRHLARQRRVVFVEYGDRDVARHAPLEDDGEEGERHDGKHHHQHPVHGLTDDAPQFAPHDLIGFFEVVAHGSDRLLDCVPVERSCRGASPLRRPAAWP